MPLFLRTLLRAPAFTLVSVLTLAIGIGANGAMFGVFHGVLLRPLPYERPGELVSLLHTAPGLDFDRLGQSAAQHLTYLEENRSFSRLGMYETRSVSITGSGEPEEVEAAVVTGGMLPTLGVAVAIGRAFSEADDGPGSPRTALLAHRYWQDRFGGDPGVIGQTVRVDGHPAEVIGVLPRGFRFLDFEPSLYLPMRLDPATVRTGAFRYEAVGRLAPGVSVGAASADVARMIPLAFDRFPGGLTRTMMEDAGLAPVILPLKDAVLGDVGSQLWMLSAMVGLVLLIACANVANLCLVHAERGRRDLAVRVALGASFARTVRAFLAESMALALAGGVLGLGIAYTGLGVLRSLGPADLPRLAEISVDGTVLAFILGLSALAGIFFGLIPLVRQRGLDLAAELKAGGRAGGSGGGRHRGRLGLAAAEVGLALVLLIGSGLLVRSFQALRAVPPGFERPEEVLTLRLTLPAVSIPEAADVARRHHEIARRLEETPGVRQVGVVSSIPMDGRTNDDVVFVEDAPTAEGELPPLRRNKRVGGDYFQAMGIPLRAGRFPDWRDVEQRADVVVVSEAFADLYWSSAEAAIGRRIREWYVGRAREIVGVVANVRDDGVDQPAPPTVYWPIATREFLGQDLHVPRSLTYALRAEAGFGAGVVDRVRDAVWAVDADLPLADVRTMADVMSASTSRTAFALVMLAIAAVMALVLGLVGIYGVISYIFATRRREIGVRIALGASRLDVTRLVLRQGALVAALGAAFGILAAALGGRLMGAFLFGVAVVDPVTYALATASVCLVTLAACCVPAIRAVRVDPNEALRTD